MIDKLIHIITPILAAFLTCSCTSEVLQLTYSEQDKKIESFVQKQLSSNPGARAEYSDGVVRIVMAEGEGEALKSGGTVSMYYAGYDFSNGSLSNEVLFATNNKDIATAAKWELSGDPSYEPIVIDMDENLLEGLKTGLVGVRRSEECYILFSGKHAYGKVSVGTIPAKAPLAYHIWVNDIEN